MELLGNYKLNHIVKLVVLLLFFSFTFLIWIPTNDMCILGNDFEMKFNHDRPRNTCINRLLSKVESNEELDNLNLRGNLINYGISPKNTNEEDVISTYGNIKKRRRINLYDHKKGYKRRYSKKKGLAKLDCYCEKILFDKFDYLDNIAQNKKNRRTSFMDKILNRYGYRLILFSLLPIVGLIFPVLFCNKDEKPTYLALFCAHENHEGDREKCKAGKLPESIFPHINVINYLNLIIFYFIIPTIYLFVIIYGFIKVVKYERLKSGKDKMNFKEYCRFCKNLF
ncbi:Plasmodium exported protein, unknown function [Plasmodium vivax]|nr:Plasmodium exported protein, unknown function [Plasmodium vivax]